MTVSRTSSRVRAPAEYRGGADDGDEEEEREQEPVEYDRRLLPFEFGVFASVLLRQPLFVPVDARVHLVQDADYLVLERIWGRSRRIVSQVGGRMTGWVF